MHQWNWPTNKPETSLRGLFSTIFILSVIAIAWSSFIQVLGDLKPCMLCWMQFGIYFLLAIASLLLLIFSNSSRFKWLILLILIGGIAVASYHCCVYFGWISTKCRITTLNSEIMMRLLQANSDSCLQNNFTIFYIPAHVVNLIIYTALALWCISKFASGSKAGHFY